MHERLAALHCPLFDKLLAVGGNAAGWATAFLANGSWHAFVGGLIVSIPTGLYFLARFQHQRQRTKHEAELHKLRIRGHHECPDCGAFNPPKSTQCWDCEAWLSD